jgi:hypothetical protein
MTSAFNLKFFTKSFKEASEDNIEEFFHDNCTVSTSENQKRVQMYPSGKPKLFQKLVCFLSGLESSFNVDKRHVQVKRLLSSLADSRSPFQRLVVREYSKVGSVF